MNNGQWFAFVCGNICMFLGIALLVPPENMEQRADTDKFLLKSSHSIFTLIITGPGRMNQYDYEIETWEKINALWLQHETPGGEINLQDTMISNEGDQNSEKFLKRQVTNFKTMCSTCCTAGSRQAEVFEIESVLKDEPGDRAQRADFTQTWEDTLELAQRSGTSRTTAGQWCQI